MSFLWWCYIETLLPLHSANAKRKKRQGEGDKNLIAESVIDIAKECVRMGVKDVFVSSVTVNTRRSSAFISAVNNILQDKCATHQFHFIEHSNIKKEHLWKDGLHLNRSGKDLLMNNFLCSLNNFF